MLIVKNLNKTYKIDKKDSFKVLNNINYTFKDTGLYIIFGRSGEGKTTFLNSLFGISNYDSGEIIYNSKKINSLSDVGAFYIPQDFGLLPKLTVYENIKLALEKYNVKKTLEETCNVLKEFCVDTLINKKVKYLSGGEKAKVAICRALLCDTKIILLDEPTQSLDVKSKETFYRLLEFHSTSKLIIMVSHDEYKKIKSNNIFMANGCFTSSQNDNSNIEITEEKNITKVNLKKFYSYFFSKKIVHFICLIVSIILIAISSIFFNNSNINIDKVLYDEIVDLNLNYMESTYEINDNIEKVDYIYDSALLRDKYSKKTTRDFEYLKYENCLPSKYIIDNNLSNDEVILSDAVIITMAKNGYLNRYDTVEETILNNINEEFIWNNHAFKIVNYYITNNLRFEPGTTFFSKYFVSQSSYIYLNLETLKVIFKDSESVLKLDSLKIENKLSDKIYFLKDSKYSVEQKLNLSDDEVVLSQSLLPKIDNYNDYLGNTINISFTNGDKTYSKNLKIIQILEYSNYVYVNSNNFEEVFTYLYDIKSANLNTIFKINNVSEYLNSINEFSLDSESDNYINFGINDLLNEFVTKLNDLKKIYSICFSLAIVFVFASLIVINILNINDFKKEIITFRYLGFKHKDVYHMFWFNRIFEYVVSILLSFVLTNTLSDNYNETLKNTFNIEVNCIQNYSILTFIVSFSFIILDVIMFKILFNIICKKIF